ncbi:MAG TPA: DUF1629 domain-containing protein, partial [Cyclobacteriaceae bacterium]|nr:DUF1629 domain-containing protein [Cyclobacteriaceae bacterium]
AKKYIRFLGEQMDHVTMFAYLKNDAIEWAFYNQKTKKIKTEQIAKTSIIKACDPYFKWFESKRINMDYYRILNDLDTPAGRWLLGNINFDDEWEFWKYLGVGKVEVPNKELFVSVREEGFPIDFNMADFELLIVNEKTANLFSKEEVQLIPIKIKGYTTKNPYFLVTLINELDCVDEEKSVFDKWEPNNDVRPDKAGQYKTFYKLVVDTNRCNGLDIFRIKDYHSIIVVSDKLKSVFEKNNISGIKYKKVT